MSSVYGVCTGRFYVLCVRESVRKILCVPGKVLYVICVHKRVLHMVCVLEGTMYNFHTSGCDISFVHERGVCIVVHRKV